MERLTKRNIFGRAMPLVGGYHIAPEHMPLIEKLAAYEDAGLTPKQVAELADRERGIGRTVFLSEAEAMPEKMEEE